MEYLQHDLKHIIEKYESNKRNPISFDFKTSTQSMLNDKYKRDNRLIFLKYPFNQVIIGVGELEANENAL